jgi:LacI family transcriptional regulator
MRVTIKDVAMWAGVSTATVSHVFNKTRYVSDETTKKVKNAAKELGYVSNSIARSLRSNKSNCIGLLVPNISNYFSVDIIEPIEWVLRKHGYRLIIGYSHEDIECEKEQVEMLNSQQIDGMLMFPSPGDHSYLKKMNYGYPIVFLDRKAKGYDADCVMGNNEDATFEAISLLIKSGHRSIGIINGISGISTTDERMQGYVKALETHNIPIDSALIKSGNSQFESGYERTKELLIDGRMTALFVANNLMTIGALHCLIKMGVKIPDEVALLGVGDSIWAEVTNPPLSVLRHPTISMGKKAAEVLLQRIKKGGHDYKDYRLPMEMVRRKTF